MLSQSPRRTLHRRASACQPSRVRPSLSRRVSRRSRAAGPCATYAGPQHRMSLRESNHLRTPVAAPPSHWLQELTTRVGTGVGRLLAMARRELSAALVATPEP